ncbi:hypothetical protein H1P_1350003 [Hyella patelloides LEGE 07179]|uniref:Uncharacterized protein n=1 Tax=Hyella patelloides LEGE 07179 TaxID=945734 RepID=A0A563VL20_9CYAN|nr:hypothetical protein [Hyella patelloides]VEP12118.1 hypothetical protein H1P_1350003 [Hyella patelloides LEGE 07179]
MNSQGNFQENSDFKAQQASDEVSNTETPDSGTKEQNQVAQSWEEQKTIIPEDIAENPLAISEDEIYDLSVANIVETEADSENLELGDFGLLDFSVDNTQDLLPFVDDDLENATDESDLEELIFDEEELSLEPPDNLDDLFAEEAIAVKEMNLDSLDTEWETHTIDIGNDDRDLGLGNFADETSLELNELSMADDLELDRLSDESSLELDEPLIEHDLELSNFANETSLELDELSMAEWLMIWN